jgi:hypothetical protein
MSQLVRPNAGTKALIEAIAALTDYVDAKMHLFSNDFTPNADTVLGDFTEVVATGVAPQTITWSDGFYDANGIPVVSTGEVLFLQTAITDTDVAFGVYVTNTAGDKLLWSARLDNAPFAFNEAGKALPVSGKMSVPGGVVDQLDVP